MEPQSKGGPEGLVRADFYSERRGKKKKDRTVKEVKGEPDEMGVTEEDHPECRRGETQVKYGNQYPNETGTQGNGRGGLTKKPYRRRKKGKKKWDPKEDDINSSYLSKQPGPGRVWAASK